MAQDAAGDVIAGAGPFSFTSRNGLIVTVDTAGVITSVGLGSTYVVIKLPSGARTLTDSVDVAVGTTTGNKAPSASERFAVQAPGANSQAATIGDSRIPRSARNPRFHISSTFRLTNESGAMARAGSWCRQRNSTAAHRSLVSYRYGSNWSVATTSTVLGSLHLPWSTTATWSNG
jgi:hypothetical protein